MKDFFRKLKLLVEGKLPDYDEYLLVSEQLSEAKSKILSLTLEKPKRVYLPVAGFDDLSNEPTDAEAHRDYAKQVDWFYETILKDKIKTSIGEIRELLAGATIEQNIHGRMSREEYDFLLRGMEAGMWKIHDWATTLQGEVKDTQNYESI